MALLGDVGVGVALLEVVCDGGWALRSQKHKSIHFLLPADQDIELSGPAPAPCLPACCPDDNGLNL